MDLNRRVVVPLSTLEAVESVTDILGVSLERDEVNLAGEGMVALLMWEGDCVITNKSAAEVVLAVVETFQKSQSRHEEP